MTDRKQPLQELLAKVEAGTARPREVFTAFDTPCQDIALQRRAEDARNAYSGSLDAAKALHEAVLPDQSIRIERRVGGWVVWLDNPYQGINDNPARAWLIAILRALIAQEQT